MFNIPENSSKWFNKKIEVRESDVHGMGVYATEDISKHEIFECAPVMILSVDFVKILENDIGRPHILNSYCFGWVPGEVVIVWGYGSLYNHANSPVPNATYRMQTKVPAVEFFAKRDIKAGEEILIHYIRGKADLDFGDDGAWWESGITFSPNGEEKLTGLDSDWRDTTGKRQRSQSIQDQTDES